MTLLGDPDDTGRRRPVPTIPDSEYEMRVGAVIASVGQKPNLKDHPGFGDLDVTRTETILVRGDTQQTSIRTYSQGEMPHQDRQRLSRP